MQNAKAKKNLSYIFNHRYLYLLLIPGVAYFLIFKYLPMYGLIIAFKDYNVFLGKNFFNGIWASQWVGFKHFETLFNSLKFWQILRNTVVISFYKLIFGFPAPILLALLLNEVKNRHFKRTIQTILYLPHFISWVVIAGIVMSLLSMEFGVIKEVFKLFNIEPFNILASEKYFRSILVISDIWKGAGWGTILYLAGLSNIDVNLYEAAKIDGASRLKQAWYITLPGLLSIIVLQLILNIGSLLNAGFDQIISLQNFMVLSVSDIFETYIYRVGLGSMEYSFTTAVGLFKSVVAVLLIVISDRISKWITEEGLF